MRIVVQKFGGTSVATSEGRRLLVGKVTNAQEKGLLPVLVVSAMGRKGEPYATDTLIDVVKQENPCVHKRELDQMMCCGELISAAVVAALLQGEQLQAVALTGGQAGIVTNGRYNEARILHISESKLLRLLEQGKIPVVCGFQGISETGEFTTLGRGGSDTTAAALGVALNAQAVEIYTDVDGIMTADPRIVPSAKRIEKIGYDEVCQLAYQGAKVIHPRAVEIAMKKNIPLWIKSTFSNSEGTLVGNFNHADFNDRVATGVAYLAGVAQIKVLHLSENEAFRVFRKLSDAGISLDLINIYSNSLFFTVQHAESDAAVEILEATGYQIEKTCGCAKVSIVGGGMRGVPGVVADMAEALASRDIEILQSVDSHTSISVLIREVNLKTAVQALHDKFQLA